ncbi:tubulin-specific chaperone cofactor E-like protein [Onthophagus taurus]|uniref:tubulin-specific chaperone cofactor E-like protein n=1 Tax=Onthophagus taurus TaxID=166361 RepID=UPI0039BE4E12
MPSLLEALEQKYGESSTESEGSEEEGISVSIFVPRRNQRVTVPSLLVLNDCDITTAGEHSALIDKCASVEELDLAKNKLNYWPEVFGILQQMPRLKFINLSFNQLSRPLKQAEVDVRIRWEFLRNLVLNSTQIDWESVRHILDYSPTLEELHLSLNDYQGVDLCEVCSKNQEILQGNDSNNCKCPSEICRNKHKHLGIKKLHFNGNPVCKWSEIKKLGYAFPNLESLVLADCPILTLDEQSQENRKREYNRTESECESNENNDSPHDSFRKLRFLNLNSSQLSNWDEIERLSKFPALQCLRIQGCPLWDSHEYTEHERRQLLIARLPNVEMLNGGGNIEHDEREDAERAFIRYYMDKPESDRPERYSELIGIHGKLDPLVNVDLRPEKRVRVTFTCGTHSEVRSVDVYRTVCDLKTRLEQFAGFPAAKMRLFYVDQDLRDIQGPEEMKFPHKQLYSYNIRSGDEIIVDSKKKLVEK